MHSQKNIKLSVTEFIQF